MQNTQTFLASAVISEVQSSDIYLTVKAKLFDLRTNLNGVRVTAQFLDEIVENKEKYIGIPLCADVRGLVNNKSIGHMYNPKTGEFHSTTIGSFYDFEKQEEDDNAFLVGYVRIMKRNKAVCKAVMNLFAEDALKFSFEISCGECGYDEDGTLVIDASEKNFLEGAAIVTIPACEEAIALELVAECLREGDENMQDTNEILENEVTEEVIAEAEEIAEATEEVAEVTEDTAEDIETAERVMVEESHVTIDETHAYNIDTGESYHECIETRTCVSTPMETEAPAALAESEEVAECGTEEKDETAECGTDKEKETAECGTSDEDKKEETAEVEEVQEEVASINYAEVIAELQTKIANLEASIAELKKSDNVCAEVINPGMNTINPFMAEISSPKKYSLLERETKTKNTERSLLERA